MLELNTVILALREESEPLYPRLFSFQGLRCRKHLQLTQASGLAMDVVHLIAFLTRP